LYAEVQKRIISERATTRDRSPRDLENLKCIQGAENQLLVDEGKHKRRMTKLRSKDTVPSR